MRSTDDIIITNAIIQLRAAGDKLRPAIVGGEVTLTSPGLIRIIEHVLSEPLEIGGATLTYVSASLDDGALEMVMRVRRSIINQNVTARVELSPSSSGDLTATISDLRVGRLGAAWLLDFVLSAVNQQPGLRQSGPRSIDIDVSALLQARNIDLEWETRIQQVRTTPAGLTIVAS
ncbi:MAG: hypothetical protein M9890_00555 [Thermomicrobiales bacterium]|nr:hypothetical protein [Thermomicrobiales bacterium]